VNAAVALNEAGAQTELMARAAKVSFHDRSPDYRPLKDRITNPRSVIGLGWRSKIAVDLPLLFHAMPEKLRHKVVAKHLGPAPGWFSRDGFVGHVKPYMSSHLEEVTEAGSKVRVRYRDPDGTAQELLVDHVMGHRFQTLSQVAEVHRSKPCGEDSDGRRDAGARFELQHLGRRPLHDRACVSKQLRSHVPLRLRSEVHGAPLVSPAGQKRLKSVPMPRLRRYR
jgi:hypothetical protein